MRPDWFKCNTCLFATAELGLVCNLNSIKKGTHAEGFCEKWICKNCWCSWDTCDYPKEEGENWRGVYHDHTKCLPVRFKE